MVTQKQIDRLERKISLLKINLEKVGKAIDGHEFSFAQLLSQEIINELGYANHLANKMAEED